MLKQNETETPTTDLSQIKERANQVLNTIDSLLSGFGITIDDGSIVDDLTVFPATPIMNDRQATIIDPLTGLPQEPMVDATIDPKTGLPIDEIREALPQVDIHALDSKVAGLTTRLDGIEGQTATALIEVKEALKIARLAISLARDASRTCSCQPKNRSVAQSDAESPF